RSIDTITVNVTYLVGSRHEGYGGTGMAHLLEHLMFRGTPRFPDIKADFQKRGARYNGSTSFDRTNYFETFPASGKTLDYVLEVEADRMVNASIARRDLDAEMTVLTLAQNHFGKIPRPSRALRRTYTVEPTQDGERAVTLRRAGDVQIVSALYHMPPGTHPEYAAVDVLVALLDHVPSGRLHKALVETGLASSVFGSERQQREAGFAYFGASLSQSASLEAARDALLRVLEGFAKAPDTEEDADPERRPPVH